MDRTLEIVLKRFYDTTRKVNGLKTDDYNKISSFFSDYYGGKSFDRIDYQVLNTSIENILKDEEFVVNIIDGVKSYPNDKAKLSERLELFLDYLEKKYKYKYSKRAFENFKIKEKNERLLLMLKYLHTGDKTRADIAEEFGISERTVSDYINVLQDGFSFLGTEMSIQGVDRGTNKYRSLIHPTFLALNSSEIYSLTVGLKLLSKDTVFEQSLGRVADLVYEQLSQSAQEMIDIHKDDTVYFKEDEMKFINSMKLGQMQESPYSYFLKEPIECIVTYWDKEKFEYKGILKLTEASEGNIYDKVELVNGNDSIILYMDKIMRIDRADKEEYFEGLKIT